MSMSPTLINIVSTTIFALAVIHTFSTKFFEHLAHKQPNHAGVWHLLGEVEAVFGFWAQKPKTASTSPNRCHTPA